MNRGQATRLLGLHEAIGFVGRWDAQGRRTAAWSRRMEPSPTYWNTLGGPVAGWHRAAASSMGEMLANRAAAQAAWGSSLGQQVARQIAIEEITAIVTMVVPVPGGGFVVAALDRWLLNVAEREVADRLEAAVQCEFGAAWAPAITVGICAAALVLVAVAMNQQGGLGRA